MFTAGPLVSCGFLWQEIRSLREAATTTAVDTRCEPVDRRSRNTPGWAAPRRDAKRRLLAATSSLLGMTVPRHDRVLCTPERNGCRVLVHPVYARRAWTTSSEDVDGVRVAVGNNAAISVSIYPSTFSALACATSRRVASGRDFIQGKLEKDTELTRF